MMPDMAVVTPLNNFLGPEGDTVTVDEQLLNTEYAAEPGAPQAPRPAHSPATAPAASPTTLPGIPNPWGKPPAAPPHSCARRIRADRTIGGPSADRRVRAWPPAPAARAHRAPPPRRPPCSHLLCTLSSE